MATPTAGLRGDPQGYRSPNLGCCPTLVELATRAVVANIDMCAMASRELWSRLPCDVLLDIYERVSTQDCLTLEAWNVLSTTLFAKREEVSRSIIHSSARISPPAPGGPLCPESLALCFGPAWSPDTSFITHLTLDSTCELDTPHLLLLPDMPNLGLLRIVEPRDTSVARPRITDRVIRAWAERKDPFPVLRILQLSCCIELTSEILRYLGSFPALVYVTVRALRSNWDSHSAFSTALKLGWRVAGWSEEVQTLMRRYFSSCIGVRYGLLERWDLAAAVVSAGKPARLSMLFDNVSTVTFGSRPAVLPWDGKVSSFPNNATCTLQEERMKDLPAYRRGSTDEGTYPDPFPWSGGSSSAEWSGSVHARPHNPYVWDLPSGWRCEAKPAVYDNPAWWIYAAIGHVILRDRDLESANTPDAAVPISNDWVLPPRPVLSLTMATEETTVTSQGGPQSGQGIEPLTKYVFVRDSAFKEVASRKTAWVPQKAPPPGSTNDGNANARTRDAPLRQRKKMKMGDLLNSMAGR